MIKNTAITLSILSLFFLFAACSNNPKGATEPVVKKKESTIHKQQQSLSYRLVKTKSWLKLNDSLLKDHALDILEVVNRTDKKNLRTLDSILIPSGFDGDIAFYLPFPESVPAINEVSKIILFSYPTQAFAAYENGELVYSGPTSMGRKRDSTPTGLYFCNWKAAQTTSTFNDEWDLKWNFNIENYKGIGFHEYALPGYPASHSCLRLREKDAKFLYSWSEQWVMNGTDGILAKGTPVIVFGTYPFDGPKPWKKLLTNPVALDLSPEVLVQSITAYMGAILSAQERRVAYFSTAALSK